MPNVKKDAKDKTTVRLAITLTPPVAKKVEALAAEEQRSTAAMLRILVERGLELEQVASK